MPCLSWMATHPNPTRGWGVLAFATVQWDQLGGGRWLRRRAAGCPTPRFTRLSIGAESRLGPRMLPSTKAATCPCMLRPLSLPAHLAVQFFFIFFICSRPMMWKRGCGVSHRRASLEEGPYGARLPPFPWVQEGWVSAAEQAG